MLKICGKTISKKSLLFLAQVLIFYRMVLNLVYSTEHPYQMQKDLFFAYAAMWAAILVFILRKNSLKRVEVWVSLGLGISFMTIYFFVRKINWTRYGKDYFRLILLYWILCILFISLVVAFIRSGVVRRTIKTNGITLLVFFAVSVFMFIYEGVSALPVVLPIISLLLTFIPPEKWMMLVNSAAIGYYLAFAQTMTKSLIQNPDRYQDGRYLGSFMELESGGAFCGGAVVCMLYFIARFILSEKKKWYNLALPLLLIIYPIYAVIRITSRGTQVALILVSLFFFAFIHKSKSKKTTAIRLAVSFVIGATMVAGLFVISKSVNDRIEAGNNAGLSYWEAHLVLLTSEEGRTGYFDDGSLLNSIDRLSSRRLAHWVESVKQIRMWGHPFEEIAFPWYEIPSTSPHNFMILWLIEYGAIGGGLVIVWLLYIGIVSIRKVLNREERTVMTFLWFIYSLGVFSFSCVRWKSPITFGLIILQYALVYREDKNRDCIEDGY